MPAHWAAIDALVQDIGELSAEVQLAERTLSTDARTRAARRALDRATDAVCAASFAPDGQTIAFDLEHWDPSNETLDGSRIGTVPAAGGEVTWLTELDEFAAWPAWSTP